MITTLTHGISSMIDNAVAAIVQSAEITASVEESEVLGMNSGITQVVKTFTHTARNKATVTGKGDLTIVPGQSSTITDGHFSSGFMTGGKITINSVKYTQKIGEPSEWSYEVNHQPFAA